MPPLTCVRVRSTDPWFVRPAGRFWSPCVSLTDPGVLCDRQARNGTAPYALQLHRFAAPRHRATLSRGKQTSCFVRRDLNTVLVPVVPEYWFIFMGLMLSHFCVSDNVSSPLTHFFLSPHRADSFLVGYQGVEWSSEDLDKYTERRCQTRGATWLPGCSII